MCSPKDSDRAIIFDIQRSSMVDGPGLRTTVFLKGCPLRCSWCHNPEAIRGQPETVLDSQGKTKTYGREMTVDEVLAVVLRDRPYYEHSGGGLTVSGGEPMLRFGFTLRLVQAASEVGIHTVLDTTGYGRGDEWQAIAPFLDLVYFDYKVTDEKAHRKHTGISRKVLMDNLKHIQKLGLPIRLRCPVVPTVNDNMEHFAAICALAENIPQLDGIDLLPYHATARFKHTQLGRAAPPDFPVPTQDDLHRWTEAMHQLGAPDTFRVAV